MGQEIKKGVTHIKNAFYFSHDGNARNDEKILMLRAEHGWQGYGIYWVLIEMMFENAETSLKHKSIKAIALSNNIKITLLDSVINTCINEKLFITDDEIFWSESLRKRKEAFENIKTNKSFAGKKGMESRYRKTVDSTLHNDVITPLYQDVNTVTTESNKERKERKGNKGNKENIKEKEIKNHYGEFGRVRLYDSEFKKLNERFGESIILDYISKVDNYVESKSKPYTNYYAAILNWLKNAGIQEFDKNKPEMKQVGRNAFKL